MFVAFFRYLINIKLSLFDIRRFFRYILTKILRFFDYISLRQVLSLTLYVAISWTIRFFAALSQIFYLKISNRVKKLVK